MDKINELNVGFNIKIEQQESYQITNYSTDHFKCNTCKKSYSNIQDFNKHLISIQHEESINYKIGLIELNAKLSELIEKDEHEKIMNRLNQELLQINTQINTRIIDKLRKKAEQDETLRIRKETINSFLSIFCLKIV